MSVRLFLNAIYNDSLVYQFQDKYYDASTLEEYVFPENNTVFDLIPLVEWNQQTLDNLYSRPIFVLTHNKWFIFGVHADQSLYLISQLEQADDDERVIAGIVIKVPNLQEGHPLKERPVVDFPEKYFARFMYMVNNGMNIHDFDQAEPEMGVDPEDIPQPMDNLPGGPVGLSDYVRSGTHMNRYVSDEPIHVQPSIMSNPGSPIMSEDNFDGAFSPRPEENIKSIQPETSDLIRDSFETLMRRLYNMPVELPSTLTVNDTIVPFINFDTASFLISQGKIINHEVNPLLQPWAGYPGTPNRIITLLDEDENVYLVKVRLVNGKIHPATF